MASNFPAKTQSGGVRPAGAGGAPALGLEHRLPPIGAPAVEGVLAENIAYHIALASAATNRQFARHIGEPLALRPVEYSLLMLLSAHGALAPTQLARALALAPPSLTMLLDRLGERGLIERARSQADRRSRRVSLTPQGHRLARTAERRTPALNATINGVLSAGERMLLLELLRKVAVLGG